MGLPVDKIGSLFSKILQKGDPGAAMAAGKGPVTAEWAITHGYKQYRTPGMPSAAGTLETAKVGTSLYSIYAKERIERKRIQQVERTTKRKKVVAEEERKKRRLLRRPSRERGIL